MTAFPRETTDASWETMWDALDQTAVPAAPTPATYELEVEESLLIDASECHVICKLPEAAAVGKGAMVSVMKTDSSRHVITIERSSNDIIDTGSTSAALALPHETIELCSDGHRSWSTSIQRR